MGTAGGQGTVNGLIGGGGATIRALSTTSFAGTSSNGNGYVESQTSGYAGGTVSAAGGAPIVTNNTNEPPSILRGSVFVFRHFNDQVS